MTDLDLDAFASLVHLDLERVGLVEGDQIAFGILRGKDGHRFAAESTGLPMSLSE